MNKYRRYEINNIEDNTGKIHSIEYKIFHEIKHFLNVLQIHFDNIS